jgi:hypothetical protein
MGNTRSRFSTQYIDRLLEYPDYSHIVELSAILWGWSGVQRDEPAYGFPEPIFIFVECLAWFAQSIRSGVWTYFEATPPERQSAMFGALKRYAPPGYAEAYAKGSREWQNESEWPNLAKWMVYNDKEAHVWLWWWAATKYRDLIDTLMD